MLNMTVGEIVKSRQAPEELLGKHLERLKERTYEFQRQQQQDLVTLERYDFNMGDFSRKIVDNTTIPVRHKYLSFVDYSFVSPQRKLKFKRSGFMGKELSQYDVSTNPEVFDKNFMLFVDGKLIDCVKIIPREQGIELVVNMITGNDKMGIEEDTFKAWHNQKLPASIIFFNNSLFNPLITNREILKKNKKFLSLSESGIADELEDDEKYLTFITSNSQGYASNLVFTPERESLLSLFSELDEGAGIQRSFINIFGFRNLSREIKLQAGVRTFQIPDYIMPIPIENVLIFKETPNGRLFASDVKIKRYYPNFYELDGNLNHDLSVLVFFSDQNELVTGYTNELDAYYQTVGDSVYTFETAPDIVRNYTPTEVDYSIANYKQSGFKTPYEYKLNLLSNLVDKNPSYLIDFLKDQFETTDGLFINMSNIDLESRKRDNNHTEIIDPFQRDEFDEPRYVITLRDIDESGKYSVNYYIDGIRYVPDKVYTRGKYSHVYIESSQINPDSYIEIERFEVFENTKMGHISPSTNKMIFMDVTDNYTRHDIYLVDSEGKYIDPTTYRVFTVDKENKIDYHAPYSMDFIPSGRVYIQMKDPEYSGELQLSIDHYHSMKTVVLTENEPFVQINMQIDEYPTESKLRLYKDGRFIDSEYVYMEHNGVHLSDTTVVSALSHKAGERLLFEYTPNTYTKVLSLKDLPQNNVIYLHGIIDRPFSLSWYDLYLNGRKLNKSHVRVLSPYLIQLVNVKSSVNFSIYQRQRLKDAIITGSKTIIDTLWETDNRFKTSMLQYDTKSGNYELDIVTEVIYFYIKHLKDFWYNEMKTLFYHINPDENQITPEQLKTYNHLLRNLDYIHLNGDVIGDEEGNVEVLHINPDIMKSSQYTRDVYNFYQYLTDQGARINPDESIDPETVEQFPNVLTGTEFMLNPDKLYPGDIQGIMHINPDK